MSGLRPKHRREIRDLLRALLDDRVWSHADTDRLFRLIWELRTDVAEEVERRITDEVAVEKAAAAKARREIAKKMRDVDYFRDEMRGIHHKAATVIEALIDLPLAKVAMTDPETGEVTYDPHAIDPQDAKIALSAIGQLLKVTGAAAPSKLEVETPGAVFDFLEPETPKA